MDGTLREYACAYCGEANETFVDPAAGLKQSYIEDCAICCHPNVLTVQVEPFTGAIVIQSVIEE